MADAIVLTDGATFKCAHMPVAVGKPIASISQVAAKTSVDGAKPILNGTVISGFTLAAGCTFGVTPALPNGTPCLQFDLSTVPATGLLSDGGQAVYTQSDLAAIATAPSGGNGVPGLVITETQTKLKA